MSRRKNNEVIETVDESVVGTFDTIKSNEIKVIDNIKSYKVIKAISNDKVIIDFDGFGIIVTVDNARDLYGKQIDIKYSGNIGKADFKYEAV